MRDTTTEARQVQLDAIRAMAPAERLRQALMASDQARALMLAGLRERFPGESDLQLMERVLGQALVPSSVHLTR